MVPRSRRSFDALRLGDEGREQLRVAVAGRHRQHGREHLRLDRGMVREPSSRERRRLADELRIVRLLRDESDHGRPEELRVLVLPGPRLEAEGARPRAERVGHEAPIVRAQLVRYEEIPRRSGDPDHRLDDLPIRVAGESGHERERRRHRHVARARESRHVRQDADALGRGEALSGIGEDSSRACSPCREPGSSPRKRRSRRPARGKAPSAGGFPSLPRAACRRRALRPRRSARRREFATSLSSSPTNRWAENAFATRRTRGGPPVHASSAVTSGTPG